MDYTKVVEIINDLDARGYPTYREAKNLAIKACEKQIPKRVVSYSDDESDHVYCPCCHECIGSNDIIYEDFYYRGFAPMHCQECGQAMVLR